MTSIANAPRVETTQASEHARVDDLINSSARIVYFAELTRDYLQQFFSVTLIATEGSQR